MYLAYEIPKIPNPTHMRTKTPYNTQYTGPHGATPTTELNLQLPQMKFSKMRIAISSHTGRITLHYQCYLSLHRYAIRDLFIPSPGFYSTFSSTFPQSVNPCSSASCGLLFSPSGRLSLVIGTVVPSVCTSLVSTYSLLSDSLLDSSSCLLLVCVDTVL